jgi:hypothetical protein
LQKGNSPGALLKRSAFDDYRIDHTFESVGLNEDGAEREDSARRLKGKDGDSAHY